MAVASREDWTFGAQLITAVGILVISVLTFVNQSNKEFRDEMRTELTAIRTEMRTEFTAIRTEMRTEFTAIRTEIVSMREDMHDMNTRLGRVEGHLRMLSNEE